MIRTLTRVSLGRLIKNTREIDLFGEERRVWELTQLVRSIDFENLGVDPAPFQLVENSSLFKVHSLFSLLGLNRAYVTKCGRLVGVVALKDVMSFCGIFFSLSKRCVFVASGRRRKGSEWGNLGRKSSHSVGEYGHERGCDNRHSSRPHSTVSSLFRRRRGRGGRGRRGCPE